MLYNSAQDWLDAPKKRVLLFGMSGLGKTHISNMLRGNGDWYHYSVDYRIGTRYMGEHIIDHVKEQAMQNPFLRDLFLTDSIYIASNITFENLAPLSAYLGKPGALNKGGLPIEEYRRRQSQHEGAEISALLDTGEFIGKADSIYGYDHFVCDTGGSICEVVDPANPNDPVLKHLADNTLMVWIEGDDAHTAELVRRFDQSPKPMCYQPEFLSHAWSEYLKQGSQTAESVDPDAFVRWTFAKAMAHRQPIYAAMAQDWGVTVSAKQAEELTSASEFNQLIADVL